jgi:transcription antitermination factor NusG
MYWYVVSTRGQREVTACTYLEKHAGLDVLYPRLEASRTDRAGKREGRTYQNIVPLFPGYLFVRDDPVDLQKIISAWKLESKPTYIQGIVSIANRPVPVDPCFMESILTALKKPPYDDVLRSDKVSTLKYPPLTPGQLVRFTDNAPISMAGRIAKFNSMKDNERVMVLFQMFSDERLIPVNRADIEPLEIQ